MQMRDKFAIRIMAALVQKDGVLAHAHTAYRLADDMMKARGPVAEEKGLEPKRCQHDYVSNPRNRHVWKCVKCGKTLL